MIDADPSPPETGLDAARRAGAPVVAGEVVSPFGQGWLIHGRKGFRPCPWAFDLVRAVPARQGDRALDLGCGCGPLLGALFQVHPQVQAAVAVELDPQLAGQAQRNARLAHAPIVVVNGDVRAAPFPPRTFDIVLANPPFYPPGWGRPSRDERQCRATHALSGGIEAFAGAAAHGLSPHGTAVFVYDAQHLTAALLAFESVGLTMRALRFLDDDRQRPSRVLLIAGHNGGGLQVSRTPWRGSPPGFRRR